jgi:succinoglycan biosynthesis transport protein ExoP
MTVQQFLLALRYRWRTALAVWAAALLIVVALAALLIPREYRATSEMLVDEENLDPIDGVALAVSGLNLPSRMATQVDIVRSERVMLQALRTIGLQNDRGLRDRWMSQAGGRGNFEAWLVERLQKKTEVRPTRDSKVLYVSHAARDPKFASDFVNALVQAYIHTTLELRLERARQYNSFFEERSRQLRERLQEAQQKASEFQRLNGITSSDEKLDVEETRLGQLSAQVMALQARADEAQRRQKEAASNPDRMEEVHRDPMVTSLATALALQELRLNELTSRMGSRHPDVLELISTTAGLRARLEAAKRRAAASFEGSSNVSASQLADRTRELEAQRQKVLQRKGVREQARLIQNEVDGAQRAFDAVVARLNKTALERSDTQPNVSVLKVATVPSVTVSASPAAIFSFAAVAALLLALVTMVVIEVRDRRLRSAQDVESLLKQPLLTVLRPRRPRGAPSSVRQLLIQTRPALTNEGIHAAH